MKKIAITLLFFIAITFTAPIIALGASFFFVDDAGNVGIGNSTPAHKLDVSGALYSRLVTLTNSSTTNVDWSAGNVESLTLSLSTTTLTFTNAQAGGEYKIILKQDSTGGRTVTWPSTVKWPDGNAPTLTVNANRTDLISFVYDGTNYLGSYSLNHYSPSILFSDDFNRADSSTIGNSWTETLNGSGVDVEIKSNQLRFNSKQSGDNIVYHDAGGTTGVGSYATIKYIPTTFSDYVSFRILSNGTLNNGFGMTANGTAGTISIHDNSTQKTSGSFTFTTGGGTAYYIEIKRTANGMQLRIWETTGSRPSTPTLEFNNGSSYTPTASGSNLFLHWWSNNSVLDDAEFDDVSVVQ